MRSGRRASLVSSELAAKPTIAREERSPVRNDAPELAPCTAPPYRVSSPRRGRAAAWMLRAPRGKHAVQKLSKRPARNPGPEHLQDRAQRFRRSEHGFQKRLEQGANTPPLMTTSADVVTSVWSPRASTLQRVAPWHAHQRLLVNLLDMGTTDGLETHAAFRRIAAQRLAYHRALRSAEPSIEIRTRNFIELVTAVDGEP